MMAFVSHVPLVRSSARSTRAICLPPTMVVGEGRMGRRAALKLAALGFGLGIAGAANAAFDLKKLKEEVEEIQYDEEVTEVGPDPKEKNITRTKRKVEEPEFRKEEKELLASDEEKYEEMIAKEAAESAEIKAKFSKK